MATSQRQHPKEPVPVRWQQRGNLVYCGLALAAILQVFSIPWYISISLFVNDRYSRSSPAASASSSPRLAPSFRNETRAAAAVRGVGGGGGGLDAVHPSPLPPPSAFTIRPNRTFAWFRGGLRLETFHSFVPSGDIDGEDGYDGYRVVYKVTERDGTLGSGRSQNVETMRLSSSFERNETSRMTLGREDIMMLAGSSKQKKGGKRKKEKEEEEEEAVVRAQQSSGLSDPRAFLWNNSAYALAWRHNKGDHDNFLFNLVTGEEHLLNHCILGYRGKNWIPLVYRGKLHVVHRVSPRIRSFEYDAHGGRGCPTPTGEPHDAEDIDQWRGGSGFVPHGSTSMISLGHRTIDGNTHVPYLLHVDMTEDGEIVGEEARKRQLSQTTTTTTTTTTAGGGNWTGILDPTSLWWDDEGRLWMGTVRTSGRWKRCYFRDSDDCVFDMTVYEVELEYNGSGDVVE